MNETRRFVVFLSCAISCLTASAGNPLHRLFDCQGVPDCVGRWCPDDYCSKQEPCVCVPLRFQCDDYCSKKEPCICPGLHFTCDDYCKKCLPKVCSSPRCDVLNCGSRCCTSGHAVASHGEATEEKEVKLAELPEESQMSYESAEEAVVDDGIWQPVRVAVPELALGE